MTAFNFTLSFRSLKITWFWKHHETLVPNAASVIRICPAGSSHRENEHDDTHPRNIIHVWTSVVSF